jgi:hypothetical protein
MTKITQARVYNFTASGSHAICENCGRVWKILEDVGPVKTDKYAKTIDGVYIFNLKARENCVFCTRPEDYIMEEVKRCRIVKKKEVEDLDE